MNTNEHRPYQVKPVGRAATPTKELRCVLRKKKLLTPARATSIGRSDRLVHMSYYLSNTTLYHTIPGACSFVLNNPKRTSILGTYKSCRPEAFVPTRCIVSFHARFNRIETNQSNQSNQSKSTYESTARVGAGVSPISGFWGVSSSVVHAFSLEETDARQRKKAVGTVKATALDTSLKHNTNATNKRKGAGAVKAMALDT